MTKLNLKNIGTRDNLCWYREKVSKSCRGCRSYENGYCKILQVRIKKTDDGWCSWWGRK